MPKSKKKIALLLSGGTWTTDKDDALFMVNEAKDVEPWLKTMPELNILGELQVMVIAPETAELSPKTWQQQAKFIREHQTEFSGFIIVTKPEQIVNTSLALNFLLQDFPVSIVVTGSQMSGNYLATKKEQLSKFIKERKGLGLRANLVNALQIAGQPLPAPAIMFGNSLLWGVKAIWQNQNGTNVFTSVDDNYWGKVDFGISLKTNLKFSLKEPKVYNKIDSNLLIIEDFVGSSLDWTAVDLSKYQGILVKVNSADLPKEKFALLRKAKLPVAIYARADFLPDQEIPVIFGCTWPTAIVKTMWALSNSDSREDFYHKMMANVIGEYN